MRVLVAGRPVVVTRKVGQVLAQQGDTFRPDGGWPATIDGRRSQLIAVRETGLALVTDDGLRTLPWPDISAVEAFDAGSLQQTFLALTSGGRHSVIHYGTTDRADLRRMVPQHLLEHPPTPTGPDEPSQPAVPTRDASGVVHRREEYKNLKNRPFLFMIIGAIVLTVVNGVLTLSENAAEIEIARSMQPESAVIEPSGSANNLTWDKKVAQLKIDFHSLEFRDQIAECAAFRQDKLGFSRTVKAIYETGKYGAHMTDLLSIQITSTYDDLCGA